ncbi:uncharacterized protein C8R40DRAFT_1130655 [Lentinula edodes]|uniref:uncharacterized protein n=1 Tax=Lentinula edodes TaxID=5353 RepID=UPI001E8D955E|nr:uncharacterized protein C8R40DRAFT_1130655 [Lentinula edodes]KAH7869524.1 hypothetical protein C8R40DRAFT_1130655 [Lentinula edodes]
MSLMAEAWALSMTTVVCPFCCCEPMSPLHLGPTLVARLYRVILCIVRSEYFWKTCSIALRINRVSFVRNRKSYRKAIVNVCTRVSKHSSQVGTKVNLVFAICSRRCLNRSPNTTNSVYAGFFVQDRGSA